MCCNRFREERFEPFRRDCDCGCGCDRGFDDGRHSRCFYGDYRRDCFMERVIDSRRSCGCGCGCR